MSFFNTKKVGRFFTSLLAISRILSFFITLFYFLKFIDKATKPTSNIEVKNLTIFLNPWIKH